MKIERVLIVAKRTALSRLAKSRSAGAVRMRKLVAEGDASVDRIEPAHHEHEETMRRVREVLASRGIDVTERQTMPDRPVRGYDLVIPVGGDGTLLGASHAIRNATPLLGVNSAPTSSVGYLTGATAETFPRLLDAAATDRVRPVDIQRLRVRIGRRTIASPVLNDVLFTADNPACMTRYRLLWPDGEELQRSSGVWIATAAGSTAALASAGGPRLPLAAKQFAFVVREPYAPPGAAVQVRSAVLDTGQTLGIECRIEQASVFLDGSHRRFGVPFGETVSFSPHSTPLRIIIPKREGKKRDSKAPPSRPARAPDR